jgi:FtsP/CotA-like multicopper oxidase with cupredoxin domain
MRSPEPVRWAVKPREIPLLLGGSMMPYRWSINGQYYPKADPVEIRKGEVIRFALRNPTGMDHPFHLHGHSFRVLGKPGGLNLTDPVLKDTINVPAKGEVVIQWLADNPGRWFFHCHIEWHLATGMARVLEIKPFV